LGGAGGQAGKEGAYQDAIAFFVGEEPVYNSEFNFHVVSAINTYYESEEGKESGFDPAKPLSEQYYPDSDLTFEDVFKQNVINDVHRVIGMYNEAKANGYVMGQWEKDCIKDFFDSLGAYAEQEGITEEEVYLNKYGIPMSREQVNGILERGFVGEAYEKELRGGTRYADAELEAYFDGHKDEVSMPDVNLVSLRLIYFANKQVALDVLEKFEAGDRSEGAFVELVRAYSADEADVEAGGMYVDLAPEGNSADSFDDVEKWVFDSERKPGDYKLLNMGGGYELAYFVEKGDPLWKSWSRKAKLEEDVKAILAAHPVTYP
jgi:hypothetical protein